MLASVALGQRLDEVSVDRAAVRTSEHSAVVRVEVQPLVRVDQRLAAAVALWTENDEGRIGYCRVTKS